MIYSTPSPATSAAGVSLGTRDFWIALEVSNIELCSLPLEWQEKNQNNYINAGNQSLLTLPRQAKKPKS